ncbi:mechanosensitive ion channel family protein [Pseudoflavitalea sp. X16]|uniref:mechanosensitive ion channel family protein n=1 Tax=Paraflavitalea devenefica TaxID=2716334 RepID=UPI00141EE7C0|nr:mechanosensitive ion channel family protein [Paraflavitalea devenefica]NII28576.1 mechanosensitive ion channel family protein [Paraflavitalea devenefica]
MNNFWSQVFLGNTLSNWVIAIGIIVVTFVALRIARSRMLSKLKVWSQRTNTQFDDFLISLINRFIVPCLYILGVYWGVQTLKLSDKMGRVADVVILFTATYFVIRLIASAIALATQAILGDLFSYFVIFFDKPFEIGDFIIVGDKMGAVEYVGIKTTRIRSLGGEQLIFSNTDLTNSRVHNYKRMEKRRVVFTFRLSYNTPVEKVNKVPGIVKRIIETQPDTQFDRAHFLSFGDFSLNFEIVYNVLSPDYNLYMDRQQAINLEIVKAFEQEGVQFAYPTQNLIVNNNGGHKAARPNDFPVNVSS